METIGGNQRDDKKLAFPSMLGNHAFTVDALQDRRFSWIGKAAIEGNHSEFALRQS